MDSLYLFMVKKHKRLENYLRDQINIILDGMGLVIESIGLYGGTNWGSFREMRVRVKKKDRDSFSAVLCLSELKGQCGVLVVSNVSHSREYTKAAIAITNIVAEALAYKTVMMSHNHEYRHYDLWEADGYTYVWTNHNSHSGREIHVLVKDMGDMPNAIHYYDHYSHGVIFSFEDAWDSSYEDV